MADGVGSINQQALDGCFGKFIQTKETFCSHATLHGGHQRETKMAPISFWPLGGSQDSGDGGRGQAPPFFQVPVLLLNKPCTHYAK